MAKEVLVQGSTAGALRAAENLADCGLTVNLVDSSPFLGLEDSREQPGYLRSVRLLNLLKNPRVKTWTNTEIQEFEWTPESCQVILSQSPRFIDLSLCTACGECVEICPVTIPGTSQKAIHLEGQPDCAVITKEGLAPCASACPAGIHVQGYVALIGNGRYQEAYQLIHDALPFPSVCGRVCNHYCEDVCSRLKIDEPVNIMGLKRFVSDWALDRGSEDLNNHSDPISKLKKEGKVAIIGAGPAGLTAARDLVRAGYSATVFDANPKPGGMMRVGIPPHRLPYDHLDQEIQQIISEGVDLQLNTWIEDIPGLLEKGFGAVLIATGAHEAIKVSLENADHRDNWLSLDFLKKVCLGEKIDLKGRKVIVLGGGDVAMDAARSAIRLGKPEVRILCRGLRASFNEIQEAEEEGVEIIRNRVFKKVILEKGKIAGVECLEADVGEVIDGKRQFTEVPGTEHLVPGDLIIWAIGQRPDFSFLPAGEGGIQHSSAGIKTNSHMMTSLEGVFTAGDVRRGTTFFVVDAVGEGHQAARSIMDYLEGIETPRSESAQIEVELSSEEVQRRMDLRPDAGAKRLGVDCIPVVERENCFAEVELTMSEKEARLAAGRCLSCGPCSECLACVEVCQSGAILHQQEITRTKVEINGLISAAELDPGAGCDCLVPLYSEEALAGAAAAFDVLQFSLESAPAPHEGNQPREVLDNGTVLVVCQCNGEISDHINTGGLCAKAAEWPEISHAQEVPSACSPEGAAHIEELLRNEKSGKVLVAACSCCSHDQVCFSCSYQRVRCKGNLGVFDHFRNEVDFVNIREGCAYLHPRSKRKATRAAMDLIGAALERRPSGNHSLVELPNRPLHTLIVGNGESAQNCLAALRKAGYEGSILPVLSGNIIRKGGRFTTPGPDGELEGDCLVVAPSSGAELDYIARAMTIADLLAEDAYEGIRRLGIIVCPPSLDPGISGRGAAGEVLAYEGRMKLRVKGPSAWVDPLLCRSCGNCLEVCGLGIPTLVEDHLGGQAWIDPRLCQDCGTCTAHCPSGAIRPGTLSDLELVETLERVLR